MVDSFVVYLFVSICLSFLHSLTCIHISLYRISQSIGHTNNNTTQYTHARSHTHTHAFIRSLTLHEEKKRQREAERKKRKIENVLLSLSPRWTRQVIYVKYLQEIIVNYEKTSFVFPRCVSAAAAADVAFFFFHFIAWVIRKKRDFDSRYKTKSLCIFLFCFHFEKEVLRAKQSEWTSERRRRRQKVYPHAECKFESKYTIIWFIYGKCAHRLNERLMQTNDKPKKIK